VGKRGSGCEEAIRDGQIGHRRQRSGHLAHGADAERSDPDILGGSFDEP